MRRFHVPFSQTLANAHLEYHLWQLSASQVKVPFVPSSHSLWWVKEINLEPHPFLCLDPLALHVWTMDLMGYQTRVTLHDVSARLVVTEAFRASNSTTFNNHLLGAPKSNSSFGDARNGIYCESNNISRQLLFWLLHSQIASTACHQWVVCWPHHKDFPVVHFRN